MSKTMKNISYELNSNEFITDKMQSIDSGCTLIESPTGSGKTSFVLEHLTTTQKVLMLVPLVGQVNQLKSMYYAKNNMAFLSGTDKSTSQQNILDHQGKHIVATYDIWPHLKSKLNFKGYTLVIDEVHKLYAAGSYRDEALNPLLDALADKTTFVKKLMLTATFTPNLAEIADILPDTWIKITRPTTVTKNLMVNIYSENWSYHWLQAVFDRLLKRTGKQMVFVRLNSNARMEKAAECLKTRGYKVLAISRRTIGNDVLKQVLTAQELPQSYDVVLTTSIFDEAINLNNANSDIDSVHIVDASAHPEEIVQFMGRLRKANPPFFLHIQKDDSFLQSSTSNDEKKSWQRIQAQYDALTNFAHASKMIAKEFGGQIEIDGLMKGIATVNTTLSNFLECSILTTKNHHVIPNKAGILACCYRTDTYHIYQHYCYLKTRLVALLPSLIVDKNCIDNKPNQSLDDLIQAVEVEQDKLQKKAIADVCQRIQSDCKADNKTIQTYGYEKINELEQDEQAANPFDGDTQAEAYKQYTLAVSLCIHLQDIANVQRALESGDNYKVIELSKSYQHDVFKNEIRKILQEECIDKNDLTILAEDAEEIIKTAFRETRIKLPVLTNIILRQPKLGISLNAGNHHIDVNRSKAMNLLVQIADMDDINANKPKTRYLILKGLHWKGYKFCNANRKPYYEEKKKIAKENTSAAELA